MGKYGKYALIAIIGVILIHSGTQAFSYLYHSSPAYYKRVRTARYALESLFFRIESLFSRSSKIIPMNKVTKTLPGRHCRLELLEERHFPGYIEAFSHRVRNYLDLPPDLNIDFLSVWLSLEITKQHYGRQITYVAFNHTNEIVGSLCISRITLPDYGQIFGWLNEKHWGSGTTQEALDLGLAEFFRVTGEAESNAFIQPFNVRCYLALKKMGFEPAGRVSNQSSPGAYIVKITAKIIENRTQKHSILPKKGDVTQLANVYEITQG